MFNSKSSDSLEHQPPPRSDPPSMVVQPPPTQVQFTTIGKQPKLLERMSAPDSNEGPPTRYPSPTPSPDLSHESMSVDVESASTRALPLSRPTLLQVLTNPDTTMSEPDALPTVQDNNILRESAEANVLSFSAVPPRLERQAVASQRVSRSTSPTSPLLVSITPQLTRNSFLNSILNSEPSTSSQNNPNSYIPSSAAPTPSPKKPVIPPPRPKQLGTTLQKSQAPPSVNQANPAPNVATPQGTQGRTLVPARVDTPQTNPSSKVTGKQLHINRYQEPVSRISTFSTSARAPSASIFSASPDSPLAKTHPAGELFNRMQTSPQKITQRNPYWENSTEEYERRSLFDNITSHSATLRYDHYSPPPNRYTEADYEASVRPPLPPTRMTVHRGDHYSPPPLGYPRRSSSPPLVGRKRPRKQWTPPELNIEQDRQWKRSRVMGSPASPVQWQEQQDDNPVPYNERMSPPTDLLSRMSDSNAVQLTDADVSPYSNIRRPYARHNPSARRGSGARGRGTSGGVPLSSRMAGGSLQDRLG